MRPSHNEAVSESARLEEMGTFGRALADVLQQVVQDNQLRGRLSAAELSRLYTGIRRADPAPIAPAPVAPSASPPVLAKDLPELEELRKQLLTESGGGFEEQIKRVRRICEIVNGLEEMR